MCGIAGFVGAGGMAELRAMGDAIAHRGPDGEGVLADPARGIHLLHRRLAIIDLAGGDQPMWNEDGSVCVIFNGEIYNHVALRAELIAHGHVFRSDHSDTEVLVHGYEQWGDALPGRLHGMFAFAIYDVPRRKLFFARDRFGKKPLYYACRRGLFAFASELTALRRHPGVAGPVDRVSLQKLFAYGFIPAPRTLYAGVSKLPGGHHMTVLLDAPEEARVERYWQFAIEPTTTIPRDPERVWGEELRHLLSQAVERRLMSDVPLGIFLSGGIDSSAVLAFAAQHQPARDIKTFSIGFHEPSFDESAYARDVARHFGTEHHERILGVDDARALAPKVLARLDEPFADPSIVPTYQLCEFAREKITVALGGDGGDEMFAGYDPFKALAIAGWYERLVPGGLKPGIRKLADLLPVSESNMGLDFRIKRGLRGASYPPALWNPVWLGPIEPAEATDLFEEPVRPEELYREAIDAWEGSAADNNVDRTLEFYTRFYLQDDILAKADRASMMVSLELRSPFLDNDLVEFARKIPHQFKYANGRTKSILKSALRGVVPDAVLERRKKGFGIPLTRWLRTWDENEFRGNVPFLKSGWVDARVKEHRRGERDHRLALWCVLALQRHALDFDQPRN
ncbi:asparagine synthase (glutamine-hydrolyzing) [Usitatibacter palustris]|uniref:asparagine synthase (glutamine-hydrolyzing) n=1 Tax=Usitatibacter palustris TaxID=2732487 RepID=A0A6M4HAA9_9PROT|nr:asparagine synthase (glutamine-hydrolyzing) [Usitatibacter palustris]QJR16496.1 Asparagine synthetase [glutamine-hydrolyzing] 1 [Usitatibacter palustris]